MSFLLSHNVLPDEFNVDLKSGFASAGMVYFLPHLYRQLWPFDQLLPVLSGSSRALREQRPGQQPRHQQAHSRCTTRGLQARRLRECRWAKPARISALILKG